MKKSRKSEEEKSRKSKKVGNQKKQEIGKKKQEIRKGYLKKNQLIKGSIKNYHVQLGPGLVLWSC